MMEGTRGVRHGPDAIDFRALADSEYTAIQHFGPDGGFIDGLLVCEGTRSVTTFLPPGTRLLAKETNEEVLSWRVAQWETTTAGSDDPPSDSLRQTIRAVSIQAALPESLKDWVRQATGTSIGLIDFLLSKEEDHHVKRLLHRQRTDLELQLRELKAP